MPTLDRSCGLVMFDVAGTTVRDDGQVEAALTYALSANALALRPDQFAAVRGMAKRDALRRLVREGSGGTRDGDAVYEQFTADVIRQFRARPAVAMPRVEDVFAMLRAGGIRVALGTGFDREIVTILLSSLGWSSAVVDVVVCGDEVARGRPAPDLIRRAMELTGVRDPREVAAVGDTTADLLAGHAAGVRWNVGVLSGAHSRAQLDAAPHTHLIDSAADVLEVIRQG